MIEREREKQTRRQTGRDERRANECHPGAQSPINPNKNDSPKVLWRNARRDMSPSKQRTNRR